MMSLIYAGQDGDETGQKLPPTPTPHFEYESSTRKQGNANDTEPVETDKNGNPIPAKKGGLPIVSVVGIIVIVVGGAGVGLYLKFAESLCGGNKEKKVIAADDYDDDDDDYTDDDVDETKA